MSFPGRLCLAVSLFGLPAFVACSSDSSSPSGESPDSGIDAAEDAMPAEAGQDAFEGGDATDASPGLTESEPNDGSVTDEYDDLPLGVSLAGALQDPGDIDVFLVPTQPGKVYHASLLVPAGSSLEGHLTVMDDGRNGKPAGNDFVKMAVAGGAQSAELLFLAMGQGAHFIAVRDDRNVEGGYVGGPGYDYQLSVVETDPSSVETGALAFPTQTNGVIDQASGLELHPFEGTAGSNVVFDVQATGKADFRLFVFSKTEGDWIARNDDRTAGDTNPLIDAPLTASGSMWLVVENVDPAAVSLGYALQASMP